MQNPFNLYNLHTGTPLKTTLRAESPSIFLEKLEEEGDSVGSFEISYWACSNAKVTEPRSTSLSKYVNH